MKKLFILASSVILLASCSNERSATLSDYEESVSMQEAITKKVVKGDLTEKTVDDEYDKEENDLVFRKGEAAKNMLMEVKDLLTESEKSEFADLVLREKRNQMNMRQAFKDQKKAAQESESESED